MSKYFINQNLRRALGAGVVSTAFVFTFGISQSFADDHGSTESEQEEQELAPAEDAAESTEVAEEVKNPSLLPGDFFYFAKKLMENVQLALTFNETKEAELLASFAEERIQEAEALLALGEEERAHELLKTAVEQQELALAKYLEVKEAEEGDDEEQPNSVDGEESSGEALPKNEGQLAVEEKLSSNLLALATALEKVKSPGAKEALQKEIEKAQLRFEEKVIEKLAKLQEKEQKTAEKLLELETKRAIGEVDEEEYQEELAELKKEAAEEQEEFLNELNEEAAEIEAEVLEAIDEETKDDKEEETEEEAKVTPVIPAKETTEKKQKETQKAEKQQDKEFKKAEERKQEELKKEEERKQEEAEKAKEAVKKAEERKQEELKKEEERKQEETEKAKEAEERKQEELKKEEEQKREKAEESKEREEDDDEDGNGND